MNKNEIMTKIQNDINKFIENYTIYEEERELFERILNVFEELKKTQTLAEFLGWEENVVYKYDNDKFVIMDGELYVRNYAMRDWVDAYDVPINDFEDLRQAKKVIYPEKYHLKLKQEYIDFFDPFGEKNILALYDNEEFMISDIGYKDGDKWKFEFTEEEIKDIVLPRFLNLDMFDKVEVK